MKKKSNKLTPQLKWMKTSLLLCFLSFGLMNASAQSKTITGHVQDSNKQPLSSVSVVVKGTTNGTMSDADGNYSLSTKVGDVIEASFIGMKPFTFTVGSANKVNIVLQDDVVALGGADGVTVVGYGSAKTKDLTSNIPTVKGDELSKHLGSSAMSAMSGKVAGVQIINSGVPGTSPTVHIRGISHFTGDDANAAHDQGPLYVVDGMLYDDISFLSNSDIKSLSVLKDASSAAIYGVRAANGVIIITTKNGVKNTKPQVTYDGYVGFQKASNVVKMASSADYTKMINEAAQEDNTYEAFKDPINKSIALYGGTNGVPNTNTDWYGELLRTALIQSHSINIAGGGEKTTYSLGVNYLDQNGIANVDNGYSRTNVRSKVDVQATDWLKLGANIVISSSVQKTVDLGSYAGAYEVPSFVPVHDPQNAGASPIDFASPSKLGFNPGLFNPMAQLTYSDGGTKNTNQILPSFYAQLSFLNDKLTVRSTFSQDLIFSRNKIFMPVYQVGGNQVATQSKLTKTDEYTNNWIVDNVATYKSSIGLNSFTAMLGNSFRKERWEQLQGTANDVPGENSESKYISQGSSTSRIASDDGTEFRGLSYFGRVMYNYSDKYLASFTMRADGSSKYQDKWGYFPSVGLGWVISKEAFMQNQKVFDFIKLRGNWGQLGNDKIPANDGFSSITQNDHTAGIFNGNIYPGYTNVSYFSSLRWEVVSEGDLGLDVTTLNNRLSANLDYYKRTTTNAVFSKQLPDGAGNILVNNGSVENSGMEVNINWNDQIQKDWTYNIGFNLSTLKNRVTKLDGMQAALYTGIAEYQKVRQVGLPMDSYWGYKVIGVYQNQAQINADPMAVAQNLIPGDFIYQHAAGETGLTDADKVILGSPIPSLYLGGNIGMNYKNWDFNLSYQGQFGAKIVNVKRFDRKNQSQMNFDENLVTNRWTGDGSTNSYPSAAGMMRSWNTISNFNSFMVESGNVFSIQNVQLGYTFKKILVNTLNNASLRLSLTAERPLSIFNYNGFTIDVPSGYDTSMYPLASTYSFGVKLIF